MIPADNFDPSRGTNILLYTSFSPLRFASLSSHRLPAKKTGAKMQTAHQ